MTEIKRVQQLYEESTDWERKRGYEYYDWQRSILFGIADKAGIKRESVVAAFCVLSPNNSERTNYIALNDCIQITKREIPADSKVSAFGRNKEKALQLLSGGDVETIISGPKVTSFYYNTMNPDDNRFVTVDGHMFNLINGQRKRLTEVRKLSQKDYCHCQEIIRTVADELNTSAPRLQSILWLTWKRVNRILWNPQLIFDFYHPADVDMAGKGLL